MKELRTVEPASHAWLYRHDREWLSMHASTIYRAPRSNNSSVDWGERDSRFAAAIDKLRDSQPGLGSDKFATRAELVRSVEGLVQKIRRLDKLPQTRAALQRIEAQRS